MKVRHLNALLNRCTPGSEIEFWDGERLIKLVEFGKSDLTGQVRLRFVPVEVQFEEPVVVADNPDYNPAMNPDNWKISPRGMTSAMCAIALGEETLKSVEIMRKVSALSEGYYRDDARENIQSALATLIKQGSAKVEDRRYSLTDQGLAKLPQFREFAGQAFEGALA